MNTHSSCRLRKRRVVILGKFDCWIEQARSFVTLAASRNKYSGQDYDVTRCDITMLVATFRVVSRSCLPWLTHGVTVAWDSSNAAGLNTNISNYSFTSYHSQFIGRHLIHKNAGRSCGRHQSESSGRLP